MRQDTPEVIRVIIVGNYPDLLQSMRRYAELLESTLLEAKMSVHRIAPKPVFGRLARHWDRGMGKWLGYLDKYLVFPIQLRRVVGKEKRQHRRLLVHIADHGNAMYALHLQNLPVVVTCHDCMNLQRALGKTSGEQLSFTGRLLQRWILHGLRKATRVIAVSGQTASDLGELTGQPAKIFPVIYPALNRTFQNLSPSAAITAIADFSPELIPAVEERRLLTHIGSNAWYKNRYGLLYLFRALRDKMPERNWHLALAGAEPTPELTDLAAMLGLSEYLTVLIKPSDPQVEALYHATTLFLFPSRKEGFGWPIIEAQTCGCLVAASDVEPMREVMSGAGIQLPPPDAFPSVEQWASAAAEVVSTRFRAGDAALEQLREAGRLNPQRFTASEMGVRLRAVYEAVLEDVSANT